MITRGDSLYIRGKDGAPAVGKVVCHGKHGVTVDCDGAQRRVRWEHILGRKEVINTRAKVVDQGVDGAIVEHEDGRRAYVQGYRAPEPEEPEQKPGAWEGLEMRKSVVLFLKAGPIKDKAGLRLEQVTDKSGRQTRRWKRGEQGQGGQQRGNPDAEEERGSKHGYGTGDVQEGDKVVFESQGEAGEGVIVAMGKDGATVKDGDGQEHKVHWADIRSRAAGGGSAGAKKADAEQAPKVLGKQEPVPADQFTAADYASDHDQADVTPEAILEQFPDDTKDKIAAAQERLASIEQTIDQYQQDGRWTEERKKCHRQILEKVLSPEQIEAATPAEGENPTLVILGGRGGSGKSAFAGEVYDPEKSIVLDADAIKGMLPEYEGWNAHQVHMESGEIFDSIVRAARDAGLNVVLDKTMKTAKATVAEVKVFKEAGYRTEAHYMHLPRQEAAKRAISRFLDGREKGRYVPLEVVLSNTTNEEAFDQVKELVDAWSFRDNNVARGEQPILISESEGSGGESQGELKKADCGPIILLWRPKP